MVNIRRNLLNCREVWFDEDWSPQDADIVLFYHWNSPVGTDLSSPVHSLEIDLTIPKSTIWGGFSASTRNQINRALREGLTFQFWSQPDRIVLADFFSFHRQFMGERRFNIADPKWMREYSDQGQLTLTRAAVPDGKTLAWHSYYRNSISVRQLHSLSLFATQEDRQLRNTIARANRFLHWMDIQQFQKCSTTRFDFGGWYPGTTDDKLLRVNSFKEEFGGVKTKRFHSTSAISAKGRFYLKVRSLIKNRVGQLHWV